MLLFTGVYVATLLALVLATSLAGQWLGLVSAVMATCVAAGAIDRGRWPLGLFIDWRDAARELVIGAALGCVLVGGCALLVAATTPVTHVRGNGFPWRELAVMLVPAVVHEELLFRGYAFQKLLRWSRWPALLGTAVIFALLHAGNPAASPLGLFNVFLGGLLLGVAYEVYGHLWLPIGIHLSWNVVLGPVSGHEVSGYAVGATLFRATGEGPDLLTGGGFGLEGSLFMTGCELIALALLLWMRRRREQLAVELPPRAENRVPAHS